MLDGATIRLVTSSATHSRHFHTRTYVNAMGSQREQVDDVWFNLMSYHQSGLPTTHLTPGQIDRAGGTSNGNRDNIAVNYFRFVDLAIGNDDNPGLSPFLPLGTFAGAVSTAGTSDVIVFSSATYIRSSGSSYRITKACVLTSRGGTVRLRQVAP